jgi:hypothetical protein
MPFENLYRETEEERARYFRFICQVAYGTCENPVQEAQKFIEELKQRTAVKLGDIVESEVAA